MRNFLQFQIWGSFFQGVKKLKPPIYFFNIINDYANPSASISGYERMILTSNKNKTAPDKLLNLKVLL